MSLKFNINRPKVTDEEIEKHRDFDRLVEQFKKQSLKKARGDESWWKSRTVRYTAIIAGITVVCTITYSSLKKQSTKTTTTAKHEITTTPPSPDKKTIRPPFKKANVDYTRYTVHPTRDTVLSHGSSRIRVPARAFADRSGNEITGSITLEYREFRDAADIIAAGIPMAYDSARKHMNLESAGMFDLRGTSNGKPVELRSGKPLVVQLASPTAEERFNQYYLDTVSGNWNYLKKDVVTVPATAAGQTIPVASLEAQAVQIESAIKMIPPRIDSVGKIFGKRIAALPTVREPARPATATPGRPTFVIDGSKTDFPELAPFDNVVFEVGKENRNYRIEYHDITWNDIKLEEGPDKGRNYNLTLTRPNQSVTMIVYPVLSGSDLEKANRMYSQKLKEYQALADRRAADEKRLRDEMEAKQKKYFDELAARQEELKRVQASIAAASERQATNRLAAEFNSLDARTKALRIFEVSRFGIFNSDCPHPQPSSEIRHAVFKVNGKNVNPGTYTLLDHKLKSVYSRAVTDPFLYDAGNDQSIFLFDHDHVLVADKKAFARGIAAGGLFEFTMHDAPDNLADFRKQLGF